MCLMPLFALTTMEKIQQVPAHVWWIIVLGILGIFFGVTLVRHIMAGAGKLLLFGLLLFAVFLVGVDWVYDRDEPAFLTPAVDYIAPFLPSKGSYGDHSPAKPVSRPAH